MTDHANKDQYHRPIPIMARIEPMIEAIHTPVLLVFAVLGFAVALNGLFDLMGM